MGRVYLAHHANLPNKRYAFKVLLGDHSASAAMRARFTREAERAEPARSPQRRPGRRLRPDPARPALHRDGLRRRPVAGVADRRRCRWRRARVDRAGARDLQGPGLRARRRDRAPRSQAGEHPGRVGARRAGAADRRLRPRDVDRSERRAADRERHDDGDAGVRRARAADRASRSITAPTCTRSA